MSEIQRRWPMTPTSLIAAALVAAAVAVAGCASNDDGDHRPPVLETAPEPAVPGATDTDPEPAGTERVEQSPGADAPSSESEPASASIEPDDGSGPAPEQVLEPSRIVVESIEVDAPLIPLGLQGDGTMEVPATGTEIGWFAPGSRVGQPGPTVIAAHVDDIAEEGAFARLVEVGVGEEIVLYGPDGSPARYRVERTADHRKDAFPTPEVFGATAHDELRLITCTGPWDPVAQSHEENRIVFATRVTDS